MHSKSNYIKSKKQKMLQKRHHKAEQRHHGQSRPSTAPIQVIVDSSSSHSSIVEVVDAKKDQPKQQARRDEKDRSQNEGKNGSGNAEGRKFNNFNFDRFKKNTGIIKFDHKPTILSVAQCLEGLEVGESNRAISYKRAGISSKKTVCENYLKSRLVEIPQEPATALPLNVQTDVKTNQQNADQKQQPKTNQSKIRRAPRYFDDEISSSGSQQNQDEEDDQQRTKKSVKCYRCGQRGHIARLCNQREILKCIYCLGLHHNSDCTDKLCHRCNEKGHIKQQCKSEKIQCRRCRMLGHVGKHCGKVLMMNYTAEREREIRQKYAKEDLEKLKCLKCNGYKDSKGHFNCQSYSKKIPRIYDDSFHRDS